MNAPFFTVEDKLHFLEVIKDINGHIHQVKQHDKAKDIDNLLIAFHEEMRCIYKELSEVGKILNIKIDKALVSKVIVEFRSAIPERSQIEKASIHLAHRVSKSKKAKASSKEVKQSLIRVKRHRQELKNIMDIVFYKLREIQKGRGVYFKLMRQRLKSANERINVAKYNIRKHTHTIADLFESNKTGDKKTFIYLEKHPSSKTYTDFVRRVFTELIDLKQALNDLNLERNQFKSIVPHYPGFRDVLQKNTSNQIRRIYFTPAQEASVKPKIQKNWIYLAGLSIDDQSIADNKKLLLNFSKSKTLFRKLDIDSFDTPLQEIINDSFPYPATNEGKERKILNRAFRILYNLSEEDDAIRELKAKLEAHDISFRSQKELKAIMAKILENDSENRVRYTQNWKINLFFEEASFIQLLDDISIEKIAQKYIDVHIESKPLLEEFDPLEGNAKHFLKLLEQQLQSNPKKEDLNKRLIELRKFYIQYKYSTVPEIEYYVRCSKAHAKWFNNRVFGDEPTPFEPFQIKNQIVKDQLTDRELRLSSKFRRIVQRFDDYIEEFFFKEVATNSFKQFNQYCRNHIVLKLKELVISRYAVLNEYLYSPQFTNLTDKIQIYGGAFGIWDNEDKRIVRLQNNNYIEEQYRVNEGLAHRSSWYDLPERALTDKGWQPNEYATEISLMFLSERQFDSVPEFYRNLNTPDNMLNIIEKENNCIFIEDGELGAFTLLYRILNGIFHSSIQFNASKFTKRTALSSNNKISEIVKVLDLKQPPQLAALVKKKSVYPRVLPNTCDEVADLPNDNDAIPPNAHEQAMSISIHDPVALEHWSAFVAKEKDRKKRFLNSPKDGEKVMLYDIYLEINFRLTLCQQVILLPEERAHVFKVEGAQDSPGFKAGNDRYSYFLSSYYGLMKALLKDLMAAIFKLDGEQPGELKLNFRPKKLNSNINDIAFEKSDVRAGKERFYNTRESRIPLNVSDIISELASQGLVYKPQETTKSSRELIKVTERYVTLCKFIEHELGNDHPPSKLKSNFKREHVTPINDKSFFIDKRLAKLKVHYQAAHQTRVVEIEKTRSSIREVVEGGFNPGRIERSKLFEQLTNILLVLFESMELYFARDKRFLQTYSKQKKERALKVNTPLRELPDYLWPRVKEQIDRITKFPIAANFYWRASGKYAQSQLIIPIASTVTKKSNNNVGFLVLGIRNIYEIAPGQFIHITLNDKLQFKELLYTLRAIFQPLMTPYLDSIYYDKIVKQTAVNSAIEAGASRVMSRNLSHNIGSHVIESIASKDKFISYFKELKEKSDEPNLIAHYTSKLLKHIEERMDIIADMATGSPKFLYPELFCNFMDDFYSNFILLDHISGIKNKTFQNINLDYDSVPETLRIALPHAWLGIQAFYVIVENIIRNAFKHTSTDFEKLTLEFRVEEIDHTTDSQELLQVKICPKFEKGDRPISMNKKQIEEDQKSIQNIINQSILDTETNKLRLGNWGILEMKIAAAYLRGIEIYTIDQEVHRPEIFSVAVNASDPDYPYLEYNLFLEKPKEILVIAPKRSLDFENELRKMGIKIISRKSDLDSELEYNLKYKEANYEFIVVCDKDYWQELTGNNISSDDSPVQRIIEDDSKVFEHKLQSEEALFLDDPIKWREDKKKLEAFQIIAWKRWIRKLSLPAKVEESIEFLREEVDFKDYKDREDLIIFDGHGINFKLFNDSQKIPSKHLIFYHPISSANYFINFYEDKRCHEHKDECLFLASLAEAAFVDIMIIDERVQKDAKKYYEASGSPILGTPTFQEVFSSAGIIVPDPDDKNGLNLQTRETIKLENITRWIRTYRPRKKKKLRFIIIHIALLEFISKGDALSQIEVLKQIIETEKKWNAQLIFVSGRGYPAILPDHSYFINYSTLYHYLFSPFCKLSLVRVLYSLKMGIH